VALAVEEVESIITVAYMLLAMPPALLVAGVDIQLKARAALAAPVLHRPAAQDCTVVVVVVLDIGPTPP
jgi:hypothetical protein